MEIKFDDNDRSTFENLAVVAICASAVVLMALFLTDCQKSQDKYKAMTPAEIKAEITNTSK